METYELFLTAIGIVLVIEGTPYATFPSGMKKMMRQILTFPDSGLRIMGFGMISLGFLIVYLVGR